MPRACLPRLDLSGKGSFFLSCRMCAKNQLQSASLCIIGRKCSPLCSNIFELLIISSHVSFSDGWANKKQMAAMSEEWHRYLNFLGFCSCQHWLFILRLFKMIGWLVDSMAGMLMDVWIDEDHLRYLRTKQGITSIRNFWTHWCLFNNKGDLLHLIMGFT